MTNDSGASNKFLGRLIAELRLESIAQTHKAVLAERTVRYWLGQERPDDQRSVEPLTRRQLFFFGIFRAYNEILSSTARLAMASEFLERLRPRDATADVLAYHVEKHLEEVYILRERINAFLRRLERLLKRRGLHRHAIGVNQAREVIIEGFGGAVLARGAHVHQARFEDSDIRRFGSLDLLVRHGRMQNLEPLRRSHARSALTKWRKATRANVRTVQELMDRLISVVEPILFERVAPK